MKRTKPNNTNKVRTVVYLPPSYHKWLRRFAEADGMTVSQFGATLIIRALRPPDKRKGMRMEILTDGVDGE